MEKLIYKNIKTHLTPFLFLFFTLGLYFVTSPLQLNNSDNSLNKVLMSANFRLSQNSEGNFTIIQNKQLNPGFNFMNIGQLTSLEISLKNN